ncbi:MAG: carbohydrate porin [Candidatus Omnitrophota bacterium]
MKMSELVGRIVLTVACFFLLCAAEAGAAEPTIAELMQEIQALKARVVELEQKVVSQSLNQVEIEKVVKGSAEWMRYKPGEGVTLEKAALDIGAGATFVLQGTPDANNAGSSEDSICDGSWSMDIEIEKTFDDWGLAFLHLETGQSDGIEDELSLFSNVNRDADNAGANVKVTEAWYEHFLFGGQLSVMGGKLDTTILMDQNAFAHDETTQFLTHMFRNSPSIEFPADNNLGVHAYACLESMKCLGFEMGYYEGDGDWEDFFDHAVYTAQVDLKPAYILGIDPEQWGGNYRLYWWINDRDHTKIVSLGETGSDETKEINYGFGLSFDQMVTDIFGLFARYGWQRPDIMPADAVQSADTAPSSPTIEHSWSAGMQVKGDYWNRADDVLAFAVGQAIASKSYKDAGGGGKGEGHIEAYYNCKLNNCLAISPDFQIIWNPNGAPSDEDNDVIFVYGMRGQVDF